MTEPAFQPQPGQIDYTHSKRAPVVNTLIRFRDKDKYLFIKRSNTMRNYPGLWNGISGFLDDEQTVEQKIRSELLEEAGLGNADIVSVVLGKPFQHVDREKDKVWEVNPALVVLATQNITLNWEGESFTWASLSELSTYKLVPGYEKVIAACIELS